jgi:imidazolonepropionase-like amidohydrolase
MPRSRLAVLVLAVLVSSPLRAAAPGVFAITGGTLHTGSGPDVENGIVLIRDGLIEAAGANIAIPADATVVDVHGAHVYPGLIDAQTSIGFPSPPAATRRRGGPQPQRQAAEVVPETSAAFVAMRNVKLTEGDLDAWRATGVLTIVTAPSFGIFNGQSAVLNLGSGLAESRIVKTPAALQISFNPRPAWTFPDSLMGVIADLRQTMLDAQQYAAAHAIYEKNPAGNRRPEIDESLAALAPVLSREVPVVFEADTELMIRRAQAIAREFNLRMIVSGARQGYRMPDELRAVPVLVSVKWPVAPAKREEREEQPLRIIRDRQLAPTTPAALAKSGVQFALVSGSGKSGDFIPGIRKAIDNGLSADDALSAVTIAPARIFGVDRQLGSLDRGKIANVVISDKPIFAKEAKVTRVFVDGREVRLPAPETRAGQSAASPIDGSWNLTVRMPQGEIAINATLHSEEGRLTGNYSSEKGSGDIRSGSFDGTAVEFTISARGQQETESGDWVFHGTIKDSNLAGTVSTNLGTFQFSGSKGP